MISSNRCCTGYGSPKPRASRRQEALLDLCPTSTLMGQHERQTRLLAESLLHTRPGILNSTDVIANDEGASSTVVPEILDVTDESSAMGAGDGESALCITSWPLVFLCEGSFHARSSDRVDRTRLPQAQHRYNHLETQPAATWPGSSRLRLLQAGWDSRN